MLDEVFAEAIVHAPVFGIPRLRGFSAHKVLGLRLRPFSFWHAFNLDLIGYNAEKLTAFSYLLLVVRCCRLRYPQTIATAATGFWKVINNLVTVCYERRFSNDIEFRASHIGRFLQYRKDYSDCVPEVESTGEQVKLPWYLYQVSILRRVEPGLTKAQAWDSPIAASIWYSLAHFAAEGAKIDLITPEDRKDFEEMERSSLTSQRTNGAKAPDPAPPESSSCSHVATALSRRAPTVASHG